MAELDRRGLLRTAGRIGAAGAIAALTGRGGWQELAPTSTTASLLGRPLRIGYLPITDASALLGAHQLQHLSAAGLGDARPVLFRSWDSLAQALTVGDIDAAHLLLPFAMQLRGQQHVPVKVISWAHTNGSTLTSAPTITSTAQLAGTRVAIPYWWSIHSVLTQRLLRSAGLTPVIRRRASASAGTVELVVMSPSDMVSALAAGSISAFSVADPFSAVAEAKRIGRVHRFLGDVWRDHACCAVTVREDLIHEHPDAVQAFSDAVVSSQSWFDTHRPDAAASLSSYLPQPQPTVARVFTRTGADYRAVTHHAGWHGEHLGFSGFPHAGFTARLVQLLGDTLIDGDTGWLPRDGHAAHADLVDDRFVARSLDRAGIAVTPREEQIEP